MTVTKTHFAYRIDRWDARGGDPIMDHVAGVDDLEVAVAAYKAACKRWPGEPVTLRQGTLVIEDSRRNLRDFGPTQSSSGIGPPFAPGFPGSRRASEANVTSAGMTG